MSQKKAEQAKLSRFWKKHIEGWKAGDLSQTDYCRQHQLKFHCFVYWRKKYAPANDAPISLVQVELPRLSTVPPSPWSSTALRVAVGEKYKIEVEKDFDSITLRQLLHVLDRL